MIYKTSSSKEIISKVYRDFDIDNQNFEFSAIEWIGEALSAIGAAPRLESTEQAFDVTSHQVSVPSDLVVLDQVYHVPGADSTADDLTEFEFVAMVESKSNLHASLGDNIDDRNDNYAETYFLNPDYINTSFETGVIVVTYKGLPVDDDGYPKVPDEYYFKEACLWYIVKKLILGGYTNSQIPYNMAEENWNKYAARAKNKANMPDKGGYENFLRNWRRLVNKNFRYDEGFTEDRVKSKGAYGNDRFGSTI